LTKKSTIALQAHTADQLVTKYLAFCGTKRSIIEFKGPFILSYPEPNTCRKRLEIYFYGTNIYIITEY